MTECDSFVRLGSIVGESFRALTAYPRSMVAGKLFESPTSDLNESDHALKVGDFHIHMNRHVR